MDKRIKNRAHKEIFPLVQIFIKSEDQIIEEIKVDEFKYEVYQDYISYAKEQILRTTAKTIGGLTSKVVIKLNLKQDKKKSLIDFKKFDIRYFNYAFFTKDSWKEDRQDVSLQNEIIKSYFELKSSGKKINKNEFSKILHKMIL